MSHFTDEGQRGKCTCSPTELRPTGTSVCRFPSFPVTWLPPSKLNILFGWVRIPTKEREVFSLSSLVFPSLHPSPLFLDSTYPPVLLSILYSKARSGCFASLSMHKEEHPPRDFIYGWNAQSFPTLAAMACLDLENVGPSQRLNPTLPRAWFLTLHFLHVIYVSTLFWCWAGETLNDEDCCALTPE